MLILLGAAGGALRGLLDAYTRFLDWQSARRAHRGLPSGQESEPPRFQDYFDPVADPVAAVVHSAMGAGAAVLLGTTGQISGAYAAVVVGISAPVILTQLGRAQSVSDAVIGASRTDLGPGGGTAGVAPERALPAQWTTPAGPESQPHVAPSGMAGPTQPTTTVPSAPAPVDEPRTDVLTTDLQPETGTREHRPNGWPVGPAGERGRGLGGYRAPRPPHGPTVGEEGTTR
ncbi:hypothetical protein ABZ471_41490 [Streptomyces sp. NPDC005728]|uniref:hypothetical protein n=1 Tax=Streptomyces sp. NPDC005728 TaxID=3157054 RepID=UPI0033EF6FFF